MVKVLIHDLLISKRNLLTEYERFQLTNMRAHEHISESLYENQQMPGDTVKSKYHGITECGKLRQHLAQQNEMQC